MTQNIYRDYLTKVDSYLGIGSNPKLREDIIVRLNLILEDYQKIEYDKEHYASMYENFLNTIIEQAKGGDINGLITSYYNIFDSGYQKKLTDLDKLMNMLIIIHENNTYQTIKDTALKLYGWVYNAPDLPIETIDTCKEKYQLFNDCLTEIEHFLGQPVHFEGSYFTSYINNMVDEMISNACTFQIDKIREKIEEVNTSKIYQELEKLTIALNKLSTIKDGSDDYYFNNRIEDFFLQIEEECFLSSNTIEEFIQEANDLIYEYRYG